MLNKFYVTLIVCSFWSTAAFTQVLEKIDENTYILRVKDQPQPGSRYYSFTSDGKKSALFEVSTVDDIGEVSAKLIKGKTALGQKVAAFKTARPVVKDSYDSGYSQPKKMNANKTAKTKKPFLSAHGVLGFGSGTLALTTKSGITGSTTANISGFGIGVDADHWIGNLSLGAEFRYSSMSVSSSGYSSSTTIQELAGTAGYLISGTKIHVKGLLYVYSSGISGLGGFSAVAKYLYNKNFSLQAEYRTLNTTSSDANGNLTTAFNLFGFGGVYNF